MKLYGDAKNCKISYSNLWICKETVNEEICLYDELNEQRASIQLIIHSSLILFSNIDSFKRVISSSGELELGYNVNCTAKFKSDNVKTQVNASLVSLFVAGGIAPGAITECTQETSPSLDDHPDFSDIYAELLIYITDYDDPGDVEYHLCLIDSILWANDVERCRWTLTSHDSLTPSSKAWWNLALSAYDGARWFLIPNSDTGDKWRNFSFVNKYSTSRIEELCVDPTITVHLVFRTKSAILKFNDNFGTYDTNAQVDITDTIMYRTTRQCLHIWRRVYNYGYLGANNSYQNLTEWSATDKAELNQVLFSFLLCGDQGSEYHSYFGVDTDYLNCSNSKSNSMEVEVAFLCGFYQCVDYTLLLCTITIIMFAWRFAIVLFIRLYIIIVVICVLGIYGAIGWEFGAIQVVAVPTVVGLSIDCALHVAYSYVHSNYGDRELRAKSAVDNIGW